MSRFLCSATATAAAGAALLLSACGGSGPTTANASDATKAQSGLEMAQCMRTHGVPNFPDPGSGGGIGIQAQRSPKGDRTLSVNGVPVNAPAFQQAMRDCQRFMPHIHLSNAQIAQLKAQSLAMARCMRSHGVPNFPDPQVGTGPFGGVAVHIGGPGSGIDPSSPAFQAAQRACGGFKTAIRAPGP